MFFWHVGVTCALVLLALGARRIDYRVVMLGSILPDLLDKPIGRIFFARRFQNGRLFGHTLLFVVVMVLAIQLVLRGSAARRWFILPIAALLHMALDGMWAQPVTLFWPLFGARFPPDPVPDYWLEVLLRPFRHPAELVREVIGLALLVYLGLAFELQHGGPRREFFRRGEVAGGAARPGRRGGQDGRRASADRVPHQGPDVPGASYREGPGGKTSSG